MEFFLTNRHFQDLNPLIAGEEACAPCHSFGPAVRKYTLIHYILSGCGTFYARGEVHRVEAGQAFLILPDEVTTYTADEHDPWHYCWIGFDGILSSRFSELGPVIDLPQMLFSRIVQLSSSPSAEILLAGELFSLYAYLFAPITRTNAYVQRVENYILSNYMHPIRVEQIALELNLDRRYLSRIFKAEKGVSIQEYLVRVRIGEAECFLLRGYSVREAAQLSGFEDVSNFWKLFKRRTGKTPASFKNRLNKKSTD